jgi:hypothetical protein
MSIRLIDYRERRVSCNTFITIKNKRRKEATEKTKKTKFFAEKSYFKYFKSTVFHFHMNNIKKLIKKSRSKIKTTTTISSFFIK